MTQGKDNNKPRIPDSVDMERLKKMEVVAKMKAFADQRGMGFVGGYYDEKTGELFQMDNKQYTSLEFTKLLIQNMPREHLSYWGCMYYNVFKGSSGVRYHCSHVCNA